MLKTLINIGMLNDQTNYVMLAIELVLFILIFAVVAVFINKKTKRRKTLVISAIYLLSGIVACILQLELVKFGLLFLGVLVSTNCLVVTNNDLKYSSRNYSPVVKTPKSTLTDEDAKEKLIDTLVAATAYLSSRKIGAIITIEKTQNLNTYIEKGVKLDAEVTVELLKTIFFPNTALHDGAVIIRGNRIMCAGTFYTPSDKPDINSELGSRHRAAIGISEDSDAFTVIVSEESGRVSTTLGGTITQGLSEEALRLSLTNHIIIQ